MSNKEDFIKTITDVNRRVRKLRDSNNVRRGRVEQTRDRDEGGTSTVCGVAGWYSAQELADLVQNLTASVVYLAKYVEEIERRALPSDLPRVGKPEPGCGATVQES